LKNALSKIKHLIEIINSRIDQTERVSELEDRLFENTELESKKRKK
jgi:hypothetical protein